MENRQVIAIDIDDVVADILSSVQRWTTEKTGVTIPVAAYYTDDDYWNYYNEILKRHGLADKLNFEMFLDEMAGDQSHVMPVQGARESIALLKRYYDLVFVTARPMDQKDATRRWLDEVIDAEIPLYFSHNPLVNGDARSKGEICMDLGATHLIDDNVNNCTNADEYGVTPLLFGAYGWNDSAPDDMVRCTAWGDVREYFENARA